ncbi:GNAT family N-acetyltransferase [Pedobacter caeni]|uniref:Protein N-acetyltransferase, RimJ/RimL family n=1 Tax=Pedobacter caeni TaxID=288992 RepID=A0A1M5ND48_9SPHI|nr:GNAT family protein [Pedobacter caeni]SHG87536.1 Protein N-acetyltransferase, RimJ/RimL family [Pedobacter caeni]
MITLQPFEEEDFQRLISWLDNEELLVQFGGPLFSFPLTSAQLQNYKNDKSRLSFKVISLPDQEVIGHAELFPSDEEKTIKICRVLIGAETKRGQGSGQQVINELLKISFLQLGKEKVELNVYDWNTNAIKCYEKAGFILNANKTSQMVIKGNTWTAVNMSIDKQHWI